jgi:hypothetical protein
MMWHPNWIFRNIFQCRKMTWHEMMWHTCMLRELKLMTCSWSKYLIDPRALLRDLKISFHEGVSLDLISVLDKKTDGGSQDQPVVVVPWALSSSGFLHLRCTKSHTVPSFSFIATRGTRFTNLQAAAVSIECRQWQFSSCELDRWWGASPVHLRLDQHYENLAHDLLLLPTASN